MGIPGNYDFLFFRGLGWAVLLSLAIWLFAALIIY